jgi:hypothetical protein
MSQELSPEFLIAHDRELFGLTRIQRPTIKILLYTDSIDVVKEPVGTFGLGRMTNLLKAHAPAFADVDVKFERRYPEGSTKAENKIDAVLCREKEPFDQIWFFGLHQVNRQTFDPGLGGGGLESELDEDEVKALGAWMDNGGGVLMTGDHAELRPSDALEPKPEFAGLGRALGRPVPRAGEMRDWDGPPTSREKDSNNTQVTPFIRCGEQFRDQILFQMDRIPQQIILPTFDEKGELAAGGQPHPLFFYRERCGFIQFFPDHLHEGQVVIPDTSDVEVWKKTAAGFQPRPRVVAYGIDKRDGKKIDLVAAYDGSAVGVGRIVADASWHHYFNINLTGFTLPTGPGSAFDQIGQFYGNLALWLTPAAKRLEMAKAMFRWLAQDPHVREEVVSAPAASVCEKLRAGATARRLLSRVSSSCEIHELLHMTIPEYYGFVESFENLPERGYELGHLPSKELLLGFVVNSYPREVLNNMDASLTSAEGRERVSAAFNVGVNEAFEEQRSKVRKTANCAQSFLVGARLRASNLSKERAGLAVDASSTTSQTSERSDAMPVCEIDSWLMELKKEDGSSSTTFPFRDIRVQGGILTGKVVDTDGNEIPLNGTCNQIVGATLAQHLALISFQFTVKKQDGTPVGIFLAGFAFFNTNTLKGKFTGRYSAFAVQAELAVGVQVVAAVDPGETGTGNGNQT